MKKKGFYINLTGMFCHGKAGPKSCVTGTWEDHVNDGAGFDINMHFKVQEYQQDTFSTVYPS